MDSGKKVLIEIKHPDDKDLAAYRNAYTQEAQMFFEQIRSEISTIRKHNRIIWIISIIVSTCLILIQLWQLCL